MAEEDKTSLTVFDFVKALSFSKKNLFSCETESLYVPFIINKAFSGHVDTLMLANDMNTRPWLGKDQHHAFLMAAVSKAKRFSEWIKKEEVTDKLRYIMAYYGYNERHAREVEPMLTEQDMTEIEQTFFTGGVAKNG